MATFIDQHAHEIRGTLSCFDRVVITGTLPDICHADAMARYLSSHDTRLFDYARWAEPHRDELRKEKRIKAIVAERGDQPGLVHIFSAMRLSPV